MTPRERKNRIVSIISLITTCISILFIIVLCIAWLLPSRNNPVIELFGSSLEGLFYVFFFTGFTSLVIYQKTRGLYWEEDIEPVPNKPKPRVKIEQKKIIQVVLKLILIILFIGCLLPMKYSYYELVRFSGLAGFTFLAYYSYKDKREEEMIVFILLALSFQPFFRLKLGRATWNIIDVIVAIGLIISLFIVRKKKTLPIQ